MIPGTSGTVSGDPAEEQRDLMSPVLWRLSVKVGDLVRFKQKDSNRLYGLGVVLGTSQDHNDFKLSRRPRLRVLFNDEQVVARFEELEVVGESR